jgi:hypothetical protein
MSNALAIEQNKLSRKFRFTGLCNISNMEIEDVAHALYKCTHASRLWNEMRKVWSLPSHVDLQHHPSMWLQSVILNIPDHMIDTTLLVSWRAWYCRNEATHNKPLLQVESSKRFLCSYCLETLKLCRWMR